MSRPVLALLLTAILLRVLLAVGLHAWLERQGRDFLIAGDADGYWQLGEALANGEPYRIYTPPRYALRMPGFPAVIAVSLTVFGPSKLPVRIGLAILGGLACGLVYLLAKEVFRDERYSAVRERAAVGALAICAVSPVMLGFAPVLLSETLFSFLVLLSLYSLAVWLRPGVCPKRRLAYAFGNGLLIGLVCYARPVWLLIAPGTAFLYVMLGGRGGRSDEVLWRRLVCGGLLIAGAVAALLPWGVRNKSVTGHFVLTTLWVGPSLYDGLHEGATGVSDMQFFEDDALLNRMSEYEMDREYRRRAWQFAANNPLEAARLSAVKLWRFWSPWPNAQQFRSVWLRLPVAVWFLLTLGLSIFALVRLKLDLWGLVLTVGPILYLTGLHLIFIGSLRYRLPSEYPLMVLAGAGAAFLFRGGDRSPSQAPDHVAGHS